MATKNDTAFLYEMKDPSDEYTGDALLEPEEEQIMKAMRKLDFLWKKYKSNPNGNRLILFCGGDCSIRFENPSAANTLETYPNITCDGGDGGDVF